MVKWCVRIAIPYKQKAWNKYDVTMEQNRDLNAFLECLRYAELIRTSKDEFAEVVDLICPHGLVSKTWAEENVKRIKTFGFNATVTHTI